MHLLAPEYFFEFSHYEGFNLYIIHFENTACWLLFTQQVGKRVSTIL
jgi:hypothetical protein